MTLIVTNPTELTVMQVIIHANTELTDICITVGGVLPILACRLHDPVVCACRQVCVCVCDSCACVCRTDLVMAYSIMQRWAVTGLERCLSTCRLSTHRTMSTATSAPWLAQQGSTGCLTSTVSSTMTPSLCPPV